MGLEGGSELEKRLAEFSARSLGLSGAGLGEAAHNVQVSVRNDRFQVQLELPGFSPEDFTLETKAEDGSSQTRTFSKEIKMPAGVVSSSAVPTQERVSSPSQLPGKFRLQRVQSSMRP